MLNNKFQGLLNDFLCGEAIAANQFEGGYLELEDGIYYPSHEAIDFYYKGVE
ncbi:hypothetical protein [Clostridium sp. C2-6-12]|uniref:hypothetical protein n=1 Tax=Clostridium sp. C2-6-12 TaxID=2698832 RepID=UPI0013699850|nr:hypothetical protein [Clostridium sp. C2-6-12]